MCAAVNQEDRTFAALQISAAYAILNAASGEVVLLVLIFILVFVSLLLFVRIELGELRFEALTNTIDENSVGALGIGHDLKQVVFDQARGEVLIEPASHRQQVNRLHLL